MHSIFESGCAQISHDSQIMMRRLVRENDTDVGRTIISKGRAAPSGDMQDYFTLAPYWTISGKRIDGVSQHGDGRLPSDLSRFDRYSLQRLCMRSYVYGTCGKILQEPSFLSISRDLLHTWFISLSTRLHPNASYAQMRPGKEINNDVGLLEFREIIWVLAMVRRSKLNSDTELRDGLCCWVSDFLRSVTENGSLRRACSRSNNVGVWVNSLAATLYAFIGDHGASKEVVRLALENLGKQIDSSGMLVAEMNRSRPLHYSLFSLAGWLTFREASLPLGIDPFRVETQSGLTLVDAINFCSVNRRDFSDYAESSASFDLRLDVTARAAKSGTDLAMPVFMPNPDFGFPPIFFV